jgi:two-component system chemotaxis response regulator CheB
MIRVLIADDSALVRAIVSQMLEESKGQFQVGGMAKNGEEAVSMATSIRPDVIIMDINMPILNGLEATRRIMKGPFPLPILIFSGEASAETSFQAMQLGAAEVMQKPSLDHLNSQEFMAHFFETLSLLTAFKLNRSTNYSASSAPVTAVAKGSNKNYSMVVLGASTGGPVAVAHVLNKLPKDFSLPIAIVQHIAEGFDQGYVDWLSTETALKVHLAANGTAPEPGHVYVSPATCHLAFQGRKLVHDHGPRILNQKPAVDKLFESAGEVFGTSLISVLLTGMGADGAEGSLKVKHRGGYTIVQDKETSAIFGMPKVAIEKGAATVILPLPRVSDELLQLTRHGEKRS